MITDAHAVGCRRTQIREVPIGVVLIIQRPHRCAVGLEPPQVVIDPGVNAAGIRAIGQQAGGRISVGFQER